jgi:putative endonuclease
LDIEIPGSFVRKEAFSARSGGESSYGRHSGALEKSKCVIAGLDPAIHPLRMNYWVYILASAPGGTLYVGVTNDLVGRTYQHREGLVAGFTKKYHVKRLVYFEPHDTAYAAIQREKNIKHWSRD